MKDLKIGNSLAKKMAAVPLGWPPSNLTRQRETFVKKVIFDLHGPILDWAKSFADVAGRLFGVDIKPEAANFYSMGHDVDIPLTPAQFTEVFDHFARLARGGYGDLAVTPNIREMFEQIHAAGIRTEIWTWVPGALDNNKATLVSHGTGIAQSATYELIRNLGLVDDVLRDVRFINPASKVPEMVEEHIPLIIEDNPVTAVEAGMNYGHAAILVPLSNNVSLQGTGILRLEDHSQIAAAVIDFFRKMEDAGALIGSDVDPTRASAPATKAKARAKTKSRRS